MHSIIKYIINFKQWQPDPKYEGQEEVGVKRMWNFRLFVSIFLYRFKFYNEFITFKTGPRKEFSG